MRVTFDSNVWQMVVTPALAAKQANHADFLTVHEALRSKQIEGFISETVGTLEAIKKIVRTPYFTSIKPIVDVRTEVEGASSIRVNVSIVPDHGQHPGLPPILRERLEAAFLLGIRLLRAPRIGIPVPAPLLGLEHYAAEKRCRILR